MGMRGYGLSGRIVLWLMPPRRRRCHGCCLWCRYFRRCSREIDSQERTHMKNGKNPTLAQKKLLRSKGLLPDAWLVVRDTAEFMEVVSRAEVSRCRMRQVEGVRVKPRTKILQKEEA